MDAQSLSNHHKSGIAIDTYCSPEFMCRLHDVSQKIPQLKRTGENFSAWAKHLKIMIGSLTGSSDYFKSELHKHDPKLNRAVFQLIFWSIDEELQQDFNIDGSAGDAFQSLAFRFQSNSSAQCIIARADFPEELLENIVNMVYLQSSEEQAYLTERKLEHMSHILQKDEACRTYSDHGRPPILNTFQNLAVVNRKFHRLCLRKLWQHMRFPSTLPASISLWTEGILLRHGQVVESLKFELEYLEDEDISEFERSVEDNTAVDNSLRVESRKGIGLINIEKIFRACPGLKSIEIDIPDALDGLNQACPITSRLKGLLRIMPHLQHLTLRDLAYGILLRASVIELIKALPSLLSLELAYFQFEEEASTEKSLGSNLAEHQNLRNLRLDWVTCADQTWTLNSWPQRLTTLELSLCHGLGPGMVQKLLSGSAPFLTRLVITFDYGQYQSDVHGQTDLPALTQLGLRDRSTFDFLVSFGGCKAIEKIEYLPPINGDQWNSMKHMLSVHTWPKLSVLKLSEIRRRDPHDWRIVTKEDVHEFWDSYKIKLLIY